MPTGGTKMKRNCRCPICVWPLCRQTERRIGPIQLRKGRIIAKTPTLLLRRISGQPDYSISTTLLGGGRLIWRHILQGDHIMFMIHLKLWRTLYDPVTLTPCMASWTLAKDKPAVIQKKGQRVAFCPVGGRGTEREREGER